MAMPWLFSAALAGAMPVVMAAIVMVNKLKRDKFLCLVNSDLFRFMNAVVLLFLGFVMPLVLVLRGRVAQGYFLMFIAAL